MAETIKFGDGVGYEAMMGIWSALIGADFLGWLNVVVGARWADIGYGNGASTESVGERSRPTLVGAIDPSPAQLDFARNRHCSGVTNFKLGSALQLHIQPKPSTWLLWRLAFSSFPIRSKESWNLGAWFGPAAGLLHTLGISREAASRTRMFMLPYAASASSLYCHLTLKLRVSMPLSDFGQMRG